MRDQSNRLGSELADQEATKGKGWKEATVKKRLRIFGLVD